MHLRIGFIGAGNIGGTLARHLALKDLLEKGKGHPVPNDIEVNHS